MPIKGLLIGGAVTAGVAGIAFGGTAISTAFSSDVQGNATVSAHNVALFADNAKTLQLTGLEPGGAPVTQTFLLQNTGSAAGALYLANVGWTVDAKGSNGYSPDPSKVTVTVTDTALNTTLMASTKLSDLIGAPAQRLAGNRTIPATAQDNITVSVTLDSTAGNNWNGAQVEVPFTLHLQDAASSSQGYVL